MITVDTRPAPPKAKVNLKAEVRKLILSTKEDLKYHIKRIAKSAKLPDGRGYDLPKHTTPIPFVCATLGCVDYKNLIRMDFVVPGTEGIVLAGYKRDPLTPSCRHCLRPGAPDPRILEKLLIEEIQKTKASDEE